MSRRRVVTVGAAGVAGAVLPLVPGTAAEGARSGRAGDPGRVFDVTRFGAKGNGVTTDSDAVNRAINEAAEARPYAGGGPGGTVYSPAGTYACYSIRLKSNVALYLAQGATLLAATPADGKGYDAAEPGAGNPYQDFAHSHWHNSLIWGEGLTDVMISGPGVIDGKGLVGGRGEENPRQGNKAIALKLCRNVTIRDITILNGGSLAILPTGVDNLRIDNLVIDTYSDGINLDCCRGVRISGTTINTPNADAIVLKSPYALDEARATENVTIDNCMVSGYDLGTLYDGTFRTPASYGRIGRIKFGTESNGGFKNIAISNVIFEYCGGLALQTVDGGLLEDVTISNVRQSLAGGLTPGDVNQNPAEEEDVYPETDMFGPLPAYGFFIRHARGITFDNVEVRFEEHDTRPAYVVRDVADADFHHVDHKEL